MSGAGTAATPGAGSTAAPGAARPAPAARGGVDAGQLRALVVALLKVRTRSRTRFGRSGQSRGLLFQIVLYAVTGVLVGMIATLGVDLFSYELILFGITLFFASFSMLAESGDLMFGAGEYEVLGHRPIAPGTLLLARTLVLFSLTALIAVAVNLAPFVQGLWVHGAQPWYPAAHLGAVLLASMFSAAAVVFAFALLAHLVGVRRFTGVASWLQLAVSITLILGYQIIPRLIARSHGFRVPLETAWLPVFPPAWFAALAALAGGAHGDRETARLLPMALTGLVVTVGLVALAVGRLAGDYARRESALAEVPARGPSGAAAAESRAETAAAAMSDREPARRAPAVARHGVASRWMEAWMRDPVERAAFGLVAVYLRRDRDLRMRVFPSLASYLAFPIVAIIDPRVGSIAPILTIVMISLLPANALFMLKTSSQFAAADLFRYAPLASTAGLFHGARKAVLLFLSAPVLAIAAGLLTLVVRDRAWLMAALPAVLLLPTLSLIEGMHGNFLPFSLPPVTGRQGALQITLYLVTAVLVAGLSALGWAAQRAGWFWPMVGVELVLVALLHAALLRGIRVRRLEPES